MMNRPNFLRLSFFAGIAVSALYGVFLVWTVQAATINLGATVPSGGGAVCGNSIVETGEGCEDNSQCPSNQTCTSCQCVGGGGGGCVPGANVCSYGSCVNGSQTVSCNDNCNSTSGTQSCVTNVCGDGTVADAEECDDNNTSSGDGCSATCQLEVGCGNGVVNPGEQCDDNNTVSGDCCSATCQQEVLISNVTESVTDFTSTIGWTTQCGSTQSTLQWGRTIALADGSASGLSGTTYSYTITNLLANTSYLYQIGATNGSVSATHDDSFTTTGGVEICNNGLDDDNDGLCDYPASQCTDGSTPGDTDCACTPNFSCITGSCQNSTQTISCTDTRTPKCQPDYQTQQGCNACEGVLCGPNQQLNTSTCSCVTIPNVCGNTVCEPPAEDPYNCPADCQVTCLSDWQCDEWVPTTCPTSGVQTRNCFDRNGCAVPINPPETQRTCGGICNGLTCSEGEQINTTTCSCEKLVPYCGNGICEQGESYASCTKDCIKPCTPAWSCESWGACSGDVQSRNCFDLNGCNLDLNRPPQVRSCSNTCSIACTNSQQIDVASCTCLEKIPYCGNRQCEASETVWSCAVDCGLPPDFRIATATCLDGYDNDNDGLVDYPDDPGCSGPSDGNELNAAEVVDAVEKAVVQVINNPAVESATSNIVAPTLAATVVVNTFASFSFFNVLTYLQFITTQPIATLFRRKRKKWGVVFNSLTKQPVDLAIVRLYDATTKRLVQSRVTDKLGRYSFLVAPGSYYITVTKPSFAFPTVYLKDEKEDTKYLDLYHGEPIAVSEQNAEINLNIPLDPPDHIAAPRKIIIQHYLRKVQKVAAFAAVPLAALSVVISPSPWTIGFLCLHIVLYFLFRRLSYQKPPKNWGVIHDANNNKPLGRAIARIYDKKYNKLLETRVTDNRGRYSFLVDNNVYVITAEKLGYEPYKSNDIDLLKRNADAAVGLDIGLKPAAGGVVETPVAQSIPAAPVEAPAQPQPQSLPTTASAPIPATSVSRESLEALLKQKEVLEDKIEEMEDALEHITPSHPSTPTTPKSIFGEPVVPPSSATPVPTTPPAPIEVVPSAVPTTPASAPEASTPSTPVTQPESETKPTKPEGPKSIFG